MSAPQTCMAVVQRRQYNAGLLVWKERTRRQMGLPHVLWLRSQNAGVPRRERHSVNVEQLGLKGRAKDQILDELKDLYIAQ